MYCSSRFIRLGLSPEKSSFIRSSLPAIYCSCMICASWFCCRAIVARSWFCSDESRVNLFSVIDFCFPSSESECSVVVMAFSDCAISSATLPLAFSVWLISFFSVVSCCRSFFCSASAFCFCLVLSENCAFPVFLLLDWRTVFLADCLFCPDDPDFRGGCAAWAITEVKTSRKKRNIAFFMRIAEHNSDSFALKLTNAASQLALPCAATSCKASAIFAGSPR